MFRINKSRRSGYDPERPVLSSVSFQLPMRLALAVVFLASDAASSVPYASACRWRKPPYSFLSQSPRPIPCVDDILDWITPSRKEDQHAEIGIRYRQAGYIARRQASQSWTARPAPYSCFLVCLSSIRIVATTASLPSSLSLCLWRAQRRPLPFPCHAPWPHSFYYPWPPRPWP